MSKTEKNKYTTTVIMIYNLKKKNGFNRLLYFRDAKTVMGNYFFRRFDNFLHQFFQSEFKITFSCDFSC
jgi:hypothetical protein